MTSRELEYIKTVADEKNASPLLPENFTSPSRPSSQSLQRIEEKSGGQNIFKQVNCLPA